MTPDHLRARLPATERPLLPRPEPKREDPEPYPLDARVVPQDAASSLSAASQQPTPQRWNSEVLLTGLSHREHPVHSDGSAPEPRSDRGAWVREPTPERHGAALHWAAPVSLRDRIRHGIAAPMAVGTTVFVVALGVALVVSLLSSRGNVLPEDTGSGAPSTVDALELAAGGNGTGTDGAPAAMTRGSGARAGEPADALGNDPHFVHVVGAVLAPGVVELPAGARVSDALDAAGGATSEAVLAGVNLARLVVDGEQIVVPDAAAVVAGESEAAAADPRSPRGEAGGKTRLNTADAAELEQLPRIGPAIAQRIIEWRIEHGPYASVDALLDVPGIGVKTLDGFRDRVEP